MEGERRKRRPNRLINEKSPYLLQHAYNPVDWYPWGEEAFERAKRLGKPIFLSIGYSTCHWCHVMERESFMNEEVAKLLNDAFVCIKVDREERPDIDSAYMSACLAMTGTGGWPLTIIMTPDKKPFFAATYIPKQSRFGRVGMLELIPRIKELWERRREDIERLAAQVIASLKSRPAAKAELSDSLLHAAYRQLSRSFDHRHGGFGRAPKFPAPHLLIFLLRYWRRYGRGMALGMVEKTLKEMRRGGIYDQLGYGFHRYSTDQAWILPHFEKMLYDQAMLAIAYTEAYQATGKEEYRATAEEVFTYVFREMTSPEGAFYSAQDADTEGEEGKYYLWRMEEIEEALPEEEAKLVIHVFNVKRDGNFRQEGTGRLTGKNVLYMRKSLYEIASELGLKEKELERRLEKARLHLLGIRERRMPPGKDDKILVDWNGLMIAALAKAAQAFDRHEYAHAARRAADFILAEMLREGKLYHRYRQGEAAIPAFLDDYAFLTWGLLELHEATFEVRYLKHAVALTDYLLENFWDADVGGFYFTSSAEELPLRKKELQDTAYPSGNSVAFLNLLRLAKMTGRAEYEEKAWKLARYFSGEVALAPHAFSFFLAALDFALSSSLVVVVGDSGKRDTQAMLRALRKEFLPGKVVLFRPAQEHEPEIARVADFTKDLKSLHGKATAYICRDYACSKPTPNVEEMLERLRGG